MSDRGNIGGENLHPNAMASPISTTETRRPGSIRRTSHIDMALDGETLTLAGRARDLVTDQNGTTLTIGDASVEADVAGAERRLDRITTSPRRDVAHLHGVSVARGFRDAVAAALSDEVSANTPLALLLDDLPVATVISGYASLYTGAIPITSPDAGPASKADICSGWRSDGTMLVTIRDRGYMPIPVGPAAPPLSDDDPVGWHDLPELQPASMRRRRLVDVTPGDVVAVHAMFRDTFADDAGAETVVHEYTLDATVERRSSEILTCDAIPRVLPWVECPVAAASASRLVGHRVDEVRSMVRADLRGTSTCTHLNDLLRSLGDVGALAAMLHGTTG